MQSNGGVAGGATIRRAPALTALSGPAAGVVGARDVAAACGIGHHHRRYRRHQRRYLPGQGRPIALTQQGQVGEWPLPLPMVDMVTIGAGGGSIAKVADGTLTVGPQSAGADPGPAAYGRGGSGDRDRRPCRAGPSSGQAAGRAHDARARRRARRSTARSPAARPIGGAARGMLAILDNNMVGALRVVSVERGHDPRDFTLVPFGGAGPLHGCALADLLGITRVLIPPAPGVLCADGLLAADLKADFSRTLPRRAGRDRASRDLRRAAHRPTTGSPPRRSRRPTARSRASR